MDNLPEMVQIARDIEELRGVMKNDDDIWLCPAATHRIAKQMCALLVALKLQAADIKRLTPLAEIGVAVSKLEARALADDNEIALIVVPFADHAIWQIRNEPLHTIMGDADSLPGALVDAGMMEVSNDK